MLCWNSITIVSTHAVAHLRWDGNSCLEVFSTSWVHVSTTQQNKSLRTGYLYTVLFVYKTISTHSDLKNCSDMQGSIWKLVQTTPLPPRTRARSKTWNSPTDDVRMAIHLFALRTKQNSVFVKPFPQNCSHGLTHKNPISCQCKNSWNIVNLQVFWKRIRSHYHDSHINTQNADLKSSVPYECTTKMSL